MVIVNKRVNAINRRMGRQKTITEEYQKDNPSAFRNLFIIESKYDRDMGTFFYDSTQAEARVVFG